MSLKEQILEKMCHVLYEIFFSHNSMAKCLFIGLRVRVRVTVKLQEIKGSCLQIR